MSVSKEFKTFQSEASGFASAFGGWIEEMGQASALDEKTRELAYISVLAASRIPGGIPFHVQSAKACGASRDEIISAVLVGFPAVGIGVIEALPLAVEAFDQNG